MVRLVVEDSEGTVELFHEEEAHHLVVESHVGERDFVVGSLIDRRGKAVGAANDKTERLDTRIH